MATTRFIIPLNPALLVIATMVAGCSSVPVAPETPDSEWIAAGFRPAPARPNTEDMSCQMLKAAVCAYDIYEVMDRDGSSDGSLPLEAGAAGKPAFCPGLPDLYVAKGVTRQSTGGDSSPRDAGFIALLSNPAERALPRDKRTPSSAVVIAFRGTLPPGAEDLDTVVRDWANDAKARLVDFGAGDTGPIKVHRGFRDALRNINTDLYKWIDTWKSEGKLADDYKVYITGHSKGGAMAFIAALELKDKKLNVAGVYTYAAARAGDNAFGKSYGAIPTWRYENQDDVVPHLPATDAELSVLKATRNEMFADLKSSGAYTSVGSLFYITDRIQFIAPGASEAALNDARLATFREKTPTRARHLQLVHTLAWAHSSSPPPTKSSEPANSHRYWRAVCGE